jgi:hypothetical protein
VTETRRSALGIDLDEVGAMRLRIAFVVLLAACAGSEPAIPDDVTPPSKEDSGEYTLSGARAWYLVGNELTPGDNTLQLAIKGPSSTSVVDLFLDGHYVKRAHRTSTGWKFTVDLTAVAPGDHSVLLAADGSSQAFAQVKFKRSHPLYVAVSNDWDTGDHGDDKLERQDRLHTNHPRMVLTHFVGPYTFTDPTVTPARAQYLVQWLKGYPQDEIGLHVHPYCNFVSRAGVTCRTSPSFAKASDATGYTVVLGAYTRTELTKIFATARDIFVANGLGTPTSFRAGGWTATGDVLAALETAGHVTDASGCNWARLEEWEFASGATLFQWNREHWMPFDETTQPYYPSEDDVLADAAPHMNILEVPDNGALVDYVSTQEMVDMFRANYTPGRALTEPKHYSIGYHPVNFSESFFVRIDGALTEIDKHLAADDKGPVIYARMSDLPRAFAR